MRRLLVPFITGLGLVFWTVFSPASAVPAAAAAAHASTGPVAVKVYASVLRKFNPQLPVWQSRDLARHVLANANRWKVDANLIVALVSVESSWHTHARSRVGAIGLGQLMPGTAGRLGVDPRNASDNLYGAARYLSGLIAKYQYHDNRYQLAFAAYNAGPHAVARFGGVPPYAETQRYVVKVMRAWKHVQSVVHLPRAVLAVVSTRYPHPNSADISYWGARR
ncbi:MAG: lytic transglycosylase domain-containing protein [Candidatus Eremiobacteraeota bacterium]|nr:lytic transglycosylase domain-containing protein [Candidatus Eremiobacteraeota bacterium]